MPKDQMPPIHIPGGVESIPIIGQNSDPFVELSKKTGLVRYIIIGQRLDESKQQVAVEYIPYAIDTITQLGLLEYGKQVIGMQMNSQMVTPDHAEQRSDCQCGCEKPKESIKIVQGKEE